MTKRCIKMLAKSNSAIESAFPWYDMNREMRWYQMAGNASMDRYLSCCVFCHAKKGLARSGKAFLLPFLYAKVRIHTCSKAAVFRSFCGVFLHEVRIIFFESFIKSHDIVYRDKVNTKRNLGSRWHKPPHLFSE